MIILCDTSSILLLLRIAPSMFIDPAYQCATLPEIHEEIFRTQKFKEKYPWRVGYKAQVKPLIRSAYRTEVFEKVLKNIRVLLDAGVINADGKLFKLSPEDCILLTCALVNEYRISTGDAGIVAFAQQEFPGMFKGNMSALGIITMWIEGGLIEWNDEKQALLAEWKKQKEASQPQSAIKKFKGLTKRAYPGS